MADPKNEPAQVAFGAMFRKAREDAGLTQQQVADSLPSTQAYISLTENAQTNPPLLTCVALAAAVGRKFEFNMDMELADVAPQESEA